MSCLQLEPEVVDELVQRVVAPVRPRSILLFGSAGRGEMGPTSDLDVLVVMPGPVAVRRLLRLDASPRPLHR